MVVAKLFILSTPEKSLGWQQCTSAIKSFAGAKIMTLTTKEHIRETTVIRFSLLALKTTKQYRL